MIHKLFSPTLRSTLMWASLYSWGSFHWGCHTVQISSKVLNAVWRQWKGKTHTLFSPLLIFLLVYSGGSIYHFLFVLKYMWEKIVLNADNLQKIEINKTIYLFEQCKFRLFIFWIIIFFLTFIGGFYRSNSGKNNWDVRTCKNKLLFISFSQLFQEARGKSGNGWRTKRWRWRVWRT